MTAFSSLTSWFRSCRSADATVCRPRRTRWSLAGRLPIPRSGAALRDLVGALLLAAALAGPLHPPAAVAQTQPQGQTTLPIATLQSGIHLIRAEVASSPQQRAAGLMFRKSLEPNHGMLFVFPEKAGHCFWMRNTLIPLSIAFIDDDGTIVNIVDMQAHSEDSHCPLRAVRFALEMEQGWFARRGIEPGSKLLGKQFFSSSS